MTKRQDETEAKDNEQSNNIMLARQFIRDGGYKIIDNHDMWHYQLHNRMKFQQLLNNIGFEKCDIQDLDQDKKDGFTQLFIEKIIKNNNCNYWDKNENVQDNFTPIRTATIKDVSTINVLLGTSLKYKKTFKKVIDATSCLVSNRDNTLSQDLIEELENIPFEDARKSIEDTVLEKVHIIDNKSFRNETDLNAELSPQLLSELELLDDPIDDIVDSRLINDDPNCSYIRVDLTCPTEQLKAQFAHWIRVNKAKKMKLIKDNIERKIKEWNSKKILEIWDLEMWCFINDVTLTHRNRIDILIPHLELNDDDFTKGYFNYCFREVFNWENINQLKSLAHRTKYHDLKKYKAKKKKEQTSKKRKQK